MIASYQTVADELRSILEEFFAPATSNERKHEIERALLAFQANHSQSIPMAVQMLENSDHQYTLMFALHILQATVNLRWLSMSPETKSEIRQSCMNNLHRLYLSQPQFITNKLIKVLADIGRIDWPHFFPDFFMQILQRMNAPETRTLGLKMLDTTLEEFLCATNSSSSLSSDDCLLLSSEQREAQKVHLLREIQLRLIEPLMSILRNTFQIYALILGMNLPIEEIDTVECTSFSREICRRSSTLPPLTEEKQNAFLTLSCLTHFVQVCPFNLFAELSKLLDYFYAWTYVGCRPSSSMLEDDAYELSIAAVNSLLELYSRHLVGPDLDILHSFQFVELLLAELSTLEPVQGDDLMRKIAKLNHAWLAKIIELFRLFFTHHFYRYDRLTTDVITDVISRLLTFTEHLPTVDLFQAALDVWQVFMNHFTPKLLTSQQDNSSVASEYENVFTNVINTMVKKICSEQNSLVLMDAMEIQFVDINDVDSDWARYLFSCCDLLAKIAEIYPLQTFQILRTTFDLQLASFVRFQYQTSHPESVVRQFQEFQALLIALGRLAELFINDCFWKYLEECKKFINKLCEGMAYCCKCEYYKGDDGPTILHDEFANVYAQILLCVKNYCHWLAQLYAEAQRTGEYNADASFVITSTVDAVTPLLSTDTPKRLLQAAVSTLYSILITVRPQHYLLCTESVKKMYAKACQLEFSSMAPEISKVLYCSLANYLILPWFNAVDYEQEWQERKPLYMKLIRALFHDFDLICQINDNPSTSTVSYTETKVKSIIVEASELIIEMLESVANESTRTKGLCFNGLKNLISGALGLICSMTQRVDLLQALLGLISASFYTLINQLGAEVTRSTVEKFVKLCETDNIKVMLANEASALSKVLEHMLKILQYIVKEMSKTFSEFTADVLRLLFQNIYPVLKSVDSIDVKQAFYAVLYWILDVRWRYFFSANVLANMENQENSERIDNLDQFLAMMQAFGESLADREPALIKQNLAYMNALNSKWTLYRRNVFAQRMYPDFVLAILQLLCQRAHPILVDDFIETLTQMVCSSDSAFRTFRSDVLPACLRRIGDMEEQQISSLMAKESFTQEIPTFSIELRRFLNDVIMYRACNIALRA